MQERGEKYRERVAGVSDKVIGHVEAMHPDEILTRSSQLEKIDTIARRAFGLNEAPSGQGSLSLSVLTNHAIVQMKASLPTVPSPENFTVVFYGLRPFCCKTARFCVTPCERLTTETPSVCDGMQRWENTRKKSFFN